jgi:uncharacterized membrane protein
MTDAPPPQQPPPQQPAPTQPAKPDLTMAWLPHLLMVLTWWLGPLILWLVKKDENKLAAFHAKQAMIWGFVPTALVVVIIIIAFIPFIGLLTLCLWPLLIVGNMAYGIVATVMTAQGKPFKYIVVADKFCQAEFAAAYPEQAAQQPPAGA